MYHSKVLSKPISNLDRTIGAINRKIRHKRTAGTKLRNLRRSRYKLIEDLNELSDLLR